MKIAIPGKGGVGKTLVAGIIARLFAKEGFDVLAIDMVPRRPKGMGFYTPNSC